MTGRAVPSTRVRRWLTPAIVCLPCVCAALPAPAPPPVPPPVPQPRPPPLSPPLPASLSPPLPAPLPASATRLEALQARVDRLVEEALDRPAAAVDGLDGLEALGAGAPLPPGAARAILLGRGLVAAASSGSGARAADAADAAAAVAAVAALEVLAPREPLAAADALLVRAAGAAARDRLDAAALQVQSALDIYAALCPTASSALATGCDPRAPWRAEQLLAAHAAAHRLADAALQHAQAALVLAQRTDDADLQARSLAAVAGRLAEQGEHDLARRLLADAERMGRVEDRPLSMAALKLFETRIAERRGDLAGSRRAAEQGLLLARRAGSPRLVARLLAGLADSQLKAGHPTAALAAAEQALPIARTVGDLRTERTLRVQRALARIALRRDAPPRSAVDPIIAVFAAGAASPGSGAGAELAGVLRAFADALAAAGDLRTALELYHRERDLVSRTMAQNRDATLSSLRGRFDRAAQQRDIDLRSHDNALRAAELHNQASAQRLWAACAAAAGLATVLVALLYRHVRRINRRLADNHAQLRLQSERDPLTGLANRRCLHALLQGRGLQRAFDGALLLVDIDHFKRINDRHGHAGGDAVLVEVARRLTLAVPPGGVVVRWGGEEFLLYVPAGSPQPPAALAACVLQAIGGEPISTAAVAVTVSVGFGSFPLPPHRAAIALERAVDLVDQALYAAKEQGRNRAVDLDALLAAGGAAVHTDGATGVAVAAPTPQTDRRQPRCSPAGTAVPAATIPQ